MIVSRNEIPFSKSLRTSTSEILSVFNRIWIEKKCFLEKGDFSFVVVNSREVKTVEEISCYREVDSLVVSGFTILAVKCFVLYAFSHFALFTRPIIAKAETKRKYLNRFRWCCSTFVSIANMKKKQIYNFVYMTKVK